MGSLKYADSRNGLLGDAAAYLVNGEGQKSHSEVLSRKKKAAEDGEIDVFSADKYFNGGMIDSNDKKLGSRCCSITSTPDHLGVVKYKTTGEVMMIRDLSSSSRPQTPSSIYSESSLNSQSALIRRQSQRRTPSRNWIKTTNNEDHNNSKKNFLVNLACHCACLDKKSVDVHHHHMKDDKLVGFDHAITVPQGRRYPQRSITVNSGAMMTTTSLIDTIDFIKMKSNTCSPKPKINGDHTITRPLSTTSPMMINLPSHDHNQQSPQEEKSRKSLEVFGSPTKTGIKVTTKSTYNMEETLINMLSWDAIPQPPADEIEIQGPKKSSTDDQTTIKDDDANESWCSEASSDLFEIKCISPRQIPMESSSCYAPSEASVEWSVVTASMAEFSLVSDSDQNQCTGLSSSLRNEAVGNNGKGSNKLSSSIMVQNDVQKRRLMSSSGGLLSGCTNQKSVRVAEDVLLKKTNKMGPADEGRRSSSSSESVHMMMTKSYKPKMSRFQPSDDVPRSGKLGYRRSN